MTQKTEQLDQPILDQIRELNNYKNVLTNTFGQIYVRRQELSEEMDKLYELEEESNASFKKTTKELQDILDKLGEKYNRGAVDINSGTITYLVEETEETNEETTDNG
jgi:hypothetical protein